MPTTKNTAWYAERYENKFGMKLLPIKPKSKLPKLNDWGNIETCADYWSDHPDENIGINLGESGFCSLDIDCMESFQTILDEFGIPYSDLENFPTIQGASKGKRILFKVPSGMELKYAKLNWPRRTKEEKPLHFTIFELRASEPGGKARFDVLPPSIHPDTLKPYKWLVQPVTPWPEPPSWLIAIWQAWESFKPQMIDACPWNEKKPRQEPKPKAARAGTDTGTTDIIGAYCDAFDLFTTLETYGYTRKGSKRYLSPHSTTNLPGVIPFPDGRACYIHHASDPLCSDETGQPVNAFDLFCYYEHGGDCSKAVKAAAELLGIKPQRKETREAKQAKAESAPTSGVPYASVPPAPTQPRSPFRCLGYDDGYYYYLPRSTHQVVAIPAGSHTNKSHMLTVAPLEWFESAFPSKQGADWLAATNSLIRWNESAGTFDPGRIRGRGAWYDAGRSVLHLGDRLMVSGQDCSIEDHDTRFIYESKPPMESLRVEGDLEDDQAIMLHAVTGKLNWTQPVNSALFAGWLVLAPICGALQWRPHIWLTGQRGTGKSWLVDNIMSPVLGSTALTVQSNSTEAGIRQRLKQDARPVVFDEAESENQQGRTRMQSVLELARQASSDGNAEIAKGTAGGKAQSFKIRSMFCMSSINVGLAQASDKSRFSVLSLSKSKGGVDGRAQFEALETLVNATLSKDFCAALRARTYKLIPVIRANSIILAKAAAEHIGNQRAGDQLGALLAGCWSLRSRDLITDYEAAEWVSGQDWGLDSDERQDSDELALSNEIMNFQIRFDTDHGMKTRNVAELMQKLSQEINDFDYTNDDAQMALGRHGLKWKDGFLIISESHTELRKMLRDTPWGGNWARILERIPGAEKLNSFRFAGIRQRAISIPLTSII